MTYALPTYLPAYLALATLSALASRRVPALRPVAACFGVWAALDAVTGPLWLRAGVFVAWPGAAVVAAAWVLRREHVREIGAVPRDECRSLLGRRAPARAIDPLEEDRRQRGGDPRDVDRASDESAVHASERREVFERGIANRHSHILPSALAAVYLLAGIASAVPYAFGNRTPYHIALPCSRALPVLLAALALASRRYPRTWAQRAAVLPAAGLVCGVVLGVWALLPAGLEAVREQWGRLAGGETAATMVGVAVCVGMAWWEARPNRP